MTQAASLNVSPVAHAMLRGAVSVVNAGPIELLPARLRGIVWCAVRQRADTVKCRLIGAGSRERRHLAERNVPRAAGTWRVGDKAKASEIGTGAVDQARGARLLAVVDTFVSKAVTPDRPKPSEFVFATSSQMPPDTGFAGLV